VLTVNKIDNPAKTDALWEFYNLGLGDPWAVSSLHGTGTGDLLDHIVTMLKELPEAPAQENTDGAIDIAIIGRPNAGKSSLTNALSGQGRSIVSDVAGTTRDAIDTIVHHDVKAKLMNRLNIMDLSVL
jgi:GTP-binding protein